MRSFQWPFVAIFCQFEHMCLRHDLALLAVSQDQSLTTLPFCQGHSLPLVQSDDLKEVKSVLRAPSYSEHRLDCSHSSFPGRIRSRPCQRRLLSSAPRILWQHDPKHWCQNEWIFNTYLLKQLILIFCCLLSISFRSAIVGQWVDFRLSKTSTIVDVNLNEG